MSFNSEMTSLADAIRAKSGVSGKLTIAGMTDAVDGIEIGGGGGSGTFDLAKVTEYIPATPDLTAISKIVIFGLGDDYFGANGTYNVTAETQTEADPWKRIYKHTSGNWYFWGEYDEEYEEGYWYIGVALDSGDLVTWTSEELSSGEYYFENWDSGDSYDATLNVTKINYPASDMVLKGMLATAYTDGEWSFASAEQSFTGFEETPKAGFIYAAAGDRLVGSSIGCPYPMLLMPLNGNLSATSYGVNITPTVNGTLTFDSHGAKFTGDQYIDLPIDVGFFAKNATVCFKIYQTGSGRYGYVAGTKDRYLGVDNNYGVFCLWAGMGDAWRIVDSDGVTGRSDVEVPQNTEVHVAYVHNAITHKYLLYIHGELVKELDNADVISGGVNLRFGAWGNGDYRFVGSMRDIRVYDKALSAEEIAAIANS